MKIFISHSMKERDGEVLIYLKERIKSYGFEPFFLEHSFKDSSMYLTERMKEEILDSGIILVFLSEDAATSQSVNHEIGFAESHKKPLIIIREKGVPMNGFYYGRDSIELDPQDTKPFVDKFNRWLKEKRNFIEMRKLMKKDQKVTREWLAIIIIFLAIVSLGMSSKD